MIIDSGKRAFTHVLVYQLDRFARDRYDSATYKHVLKKNGVKVLSAKENITDDASSVLMESVLEGMAEYYSKELAQKVKRGMEMSAKKGKYIGGSRVFGFNIIEDKTFVINEEEAKWVRIVFDMYSNRTTLEDISKYLNDQHVKTNNGKRWEYKHINRMISNRKYIGEYTYKGEVNKDCIPSIVSRESWDRAQALKKQRKHKVN